MRDSMKIIFMSFLFVSVSVLNANMSVDQQIQNIKKAPPQKRVEMMNALKVQLSQMNSHERSQAISKMRSSMRPKEHSTSQQPHQPPPHSSGNHQSPNQQSANHQSDSMHQMDGMQRMNQNNIGGQYLHNDINNPPPPGTPPHNNQPNNWMRH